MTSSPELPVPDAALEMLSRTITVQLTLSATGHCVNTRDHDAVRAIAGPVVAAVLREVANEEAALPDRSDYFSREADPRVFAARLRARADEIDPGGEAATEALRAAEEERQP